MRDSDQWDKRYRVQNYVYGTEPNDFLRSVVDRLPKGRTVCIGEGEGRNAVFLASQGHEVTAVDFSSAGLEKTRLLASRNKVEIATKYADLREFEFGVAQWNVVVSVFCHLPSDVRREVHRRVVHGLAAGGVFVLEAYTPGQLRYGTGGPPCSDMLVTLRDLKSELQTLDFLIASEIVRDVAEGRLHDGQSSVVQILARK